MLRAWIMLVGLTMMAGLMAQPGFMQGGGSFWMESGADGQAYSVIIHYRQTMPEVMARPTPGGLAISVRQGTSGQGAFFTNQMSQTIPVPPDADLSGLTRVDAPGRILYRIPRRPLTTPWPYRY